MLLWLFLPHRKTRKAWVPDGNRPSYGDGARPEPVAQKHSGGANLPCQHGLCPKAAEVSGSHCFPSPLITCRQALGSRSSWSLKRKIPIQKALVGPWSLSPLLPSLCSGGGVHWLVEQIFCFYWGERKVRVLPGERFWHTEGKTSPPVSPVVRFRDEKRAVTVGHQGCFHESASNERSPYVRAWIWSEKSLWTTVNEKALWESVDNTEINAGCGASSSVECRPACVGSWVWSQRMKDKWNQPARWLGGKTAFYQDWWS